MHARLLTLLSGRFFSLVFFLALLSASAHAATQTVAYYNFGTVATGTASPPLSPTSGNGTISFSGFAASNIVYFGGTTVNGQTGETAGAALALQGGTGAVAAGTGGNNGGYLQLTASTVGVNGLTLSFATQKTPTGFNSNQLSYSSDGGTTFTAFGSPYNPATSFALQTFDLSAITALNNNAADVFRIAFTGATSASGNNRIDNLTLAGTPVPLTAIYNYNNDGSNFSGGFTTAIPAAGTTTGDTLTFGGTAYNAADDLTSSQPLNANVVTFSNTGAVTLNRGAGQNLLTLGGTAPIVNFNNSGTLNVALDVALAADTTFTGTGSATIGGVISGTGGLLKSGAGTLTLSGANIYTGLTTIDSGTLQIGSNNAIASGGSVLMTAFNGGAVLDLNGHNLTLDVLTASSSRPDATTQVNGSGTLTIGAGNSSFSYYSVLGFTNSSGLTLVKNGTGTVTLGSPANNYGGGTVINGGTLQADDDHAFGATTGALTVNAGTLDLNGHSPAVGALNGTGGAVSNSSTDTASLTVGGGNAAGTYAGVIADGSGGGSVSLTKLGTGTQILTGVNTYSGGTTVSAGALSGPTSSYSTGNVAVTAGATADYTQNAASAYAAGITGTGSVTVGANPGGGLTSGGTITYTGVDSAAGGTTVKAGTLLLNHTGGGALTGPVAVATGGIVELGTNNQIQQPGTATMTLSGGTLKMDGHSEGVPTAAALGGLVLTGTTSTLDFGDASGASPVTLAFADSSALAWTGTVQLTNYTNGTDQLYIGTTNDLTVTQLSDITFNGIHASQLPSGKITFAPAPEPSGIAAMLVGMAMLITVIARRRRNALTPDTGLERISIFMASRFFTARIARTFGLALLGLTFLGAPGRVFAQSQRTLTGSIPHAVAYAKPMSRLSASQPMRLAITLPLRNQLQLDDLLRGLYDPTDPRYGQYLTPTEFAANFSPTVQDYKRAIAYARSLGLIVTAIHPNRTLLDVTGSAAAVERAFNVHLLVYQSPRNGRAFYAPDSNPAIDSSLSGIISGVVGLDNAVVRRPHNRKKPLEAMDFLNDYALPNTIGTGPSGGLTPSDIKKAYGLTGVTQTGSGQTLALFELSGYKASDITFYKNYFSLPNVPLQNILVDGASSTDTTGADEVTLDIELQIALAPGATKILVYEGPNSSAGVLDTYNRIATDNIAKSISTSWGASEDPASTDNTSENAIFLQMAAQGQSIFAAAGDEGAYDNTSSLSVDDPASQPYVTGVGGTTLSINAQTQAYISESTWADPTDKRNSPFGAGGGGGISKIWSIPSWQQGVITAASKGSTTKRNVPDVSLESDSNTGYAIYYSGAWSVFGGTSCAAPLWSAFAALVNQKRIAAGSSVLGFANPPIYTIGTSASYASTFHDIADGSTNLYYPAVTGYDNATGWGTFNGANLLTALSGSSVAVPPSAPTTLTATAGNAQVTLSWTAVAGATSYKIYRGTAAGAESTTAIVTGITATTYTNTGLTNGTTYFYKVTAVSSVGEGFLSNEASAKPVATVTIPTAPASLTATAGDKQVTLSWTASAGATSYSIYRGTATGAESANAIVTGITATTYTNTGLTNGTTYFYKVTAVNTAGESPKSTEASATPLVIVTTQILSNPGFENGSAGTTPWVSTSGLGAGVVNRSIAEPPHGGKWDAWLCGYGQTDTDTLYQAATISANVTTATLTFWLHIDTSETSTTNTPDTLAVQVRNSSGTVLATLGTYTNLNAAKGYTQQTFDLSAYKGQTIQIYLVGKEDSRRQTSFVVDDFALNVQ